MTTTTPKTIKSPKYPGWTIVTHTADRYTMKRDAGLFGVEVRPGEFGGWMGVLLTVRRDGTMGPAITPYRHVPLACVREAERRAAYMASKRVLN